MANGATNYGPQHSLQPSVADRFCANTEWSLIFPDAAVSHMDFDFSDHLPIVLECKPRSSRGCSKQRRFQFKNM